MNNLRKGFIIEGLEFYESPYEDIYVTTNGIVWNMRNVGKKKGKPTRGSNCNGYLQVCFRENGKPIHPFVHRLVAETFIPIPDHLKHLPKLDINHKDENKQNNAVENLEWCTREYNNNYGTHNERVAKSLLGIHINRPDLSKTIVGINKTTREVVEFPSTKEAERQLGIGDSQICNCLKGRYKSAGGYIWFYKDEYYKKE